MPSPSPFPAPHESIPFVETIVVDAGISTFREVLRQTLARVEQDTPGMVVAVRVNVVRRMLPPEIARQRLDPARGIWVELFGEVLRVAYTR